MRGTQTWAMNRTGAVIYPYSYVILWKSPRKGVEFWQAWAQIPSKTPMSEAKQVFRVNFGEINILQYRRMNEQR